MLVEFAHFEHEWVTVAEVVLAELPGQTAERLQHGDLHFVARFQSDQIAGKAVAANTSFYGRPSKSEARTENE